jgi:hypothetical protein
MELYSPSIIYAAGFLGGYLEEELPHNAIGEKDIEASSDSPFR